MNKIIQLFLVISITFSLKISATNLVQLKNVNIDLNNNVSLQKGAKIYFNHCQGCHGIKYMRYATLAEGIGLKSTEEKSIEMIIKETFMHATKNANENSQILGAMSKETASKWFGKAPPDLSLISRYRGKDWLYTYMNSFYKDDTKTWGVNNLLFPDVGMPHVLLRFQGVQILKENSHNMTNIDDLLELIENGELSKNEYNNMVKDLVTFLSYVGEPTQVERENLGIKVIIFLVILMILLYMLKKEYWKDIR